MSGGSEVCQLYFQILTFCPSIPGNPGKPCERNNKYCDCFEMPLGTGYEQIQSVIFKMAIPSIPRLGKQELPLLLENISCTHLPLPSLLWDPSHPFRLWIPRRKPKERVNELILCLCGVAAGIKAFQNDRLPRPTPSFLQSSRLK